MSFNLFGKYVLDDKHTNDDPRLLKEIYNKFLHRFHQYLLFEGSCQNRDTIQLIKIL
jgi:hypothetical protein